MDWNRLDYQKISFKKGEIKMKYNVQMLVTGTVTKVIEAETPAEAKEIAMDMYGDNSVALCSRCAYIVDGLSISEDLDTYEVEPAE